MIVFTESLRRGGGGVGGGRGMKTEFLGLCGEALAHT